MYFWSMKQLIYSAGILFMSAFGSAAQTIAFEENFDSGIPSSFVIYNQDGYTPHADVAEYTNAWISKQDPSDAANTVASATSYFDPVGMADRWLVTPSITLGSFGNTLSWTGKSHDASFAESYLVLLSTTDTAVESFTDTLKAVVNENIYWTNHSVDLSQEGYNDQIVHIAFVLRTIDGFKFYLDSVKVEKDNPVGIDTKTIADFKIYPNPAADFISYKTEFPVQKAIVRDVNGSVIIETTGRQIDVRHLSNGIYFIELIHSSGVSSKRFMKQ